MSTTASSVETKPQSINIIDLYCGAGGFSAGLERHTHNNANVIAAFDNWETAVDTYNKNRTDDHAYVEDLSEFSPRDAEDTYGVSPEDVDVIVGGPPCQGFSSMGKRDPDDERNNHIYNYLSWVWQCDPDIWVLENVKDLQSMRDGKILEHIIDTGESLGYDMDHRVLRADNFGVRQQRKRLIVVGDQTGHWTWPEPTSQGKTMRVELVLQSLYDDAPVYPGGEKHQYYSNHKPANHGDSTLLRFFDEADIGEDVFDAETQIRLDPDKPARTITGSNAHWHPCIPRELTIREQAAIQTFPNWYHFDGIKEEQQTQVGNAVPPKLAERIGHSIIDALQ